jgi:FkbM family methyltransferase
MGAVLDAALQRAFPRGERIRFIQIGGNDGIHEDPLYQHHLDGSFDFEWGQVFEPIPEYFEKLTSNLQQFPYITCHRLAVDDAPKPGTREFNYVAPADIENLNLPPSSKGIGSFSRDRNALGGIGYSEPKFRAIKDHIRTIEVETVPIGEVTSQYADANFLLTDCEGHDIEIISAAFGSDAFRPKLVQFEYLGHADDLLKSTLEQLQTEGYRITRAGKDVVCELG